MLSRTHGSSPDSSAQQGSLHLCSDEKLWAVKQVSTSNTVFVTKVHDAQAVENDADGDTNMGELDDNTAPNDNADALGNETGNRGITTIAQVKNILELIPVEPSEKSVEYQMLSMVQKAAADVDGEDDDSIEDILSKGHDNTRYSFRELLDNIPAPTMLCCRVAKNVFLIHDPTVQDSSQTVTVRPSHLLTAWKDFTQQCILLGANVDNGVERAQKAASQSSDRTTARFGPVFQHLDAQHEPGKSAVSISDFPSTLMRAILRRFKTRTTPVTDRDNEPAPNLLLDDDWDSEPLAGGWDAEALTATLGRWELQRALRTTESKSIRYDVFFDTHWKDLVPDVWHRFCNVEVLLGQSTPSPFDGLPLPLELYNETVTDEFGVPEGKQCIRVVGAGTSSSTHVLAPGVTAKGVTPGNKTSSNDDTTANSAADDAKNQKKRKWHEKFGAQRSAAVKK